MGDCVSDHSGAAARDREYVVHVYQPANYELLTQRREEHVHSALTAERLQCRRVGVNTLTTTHTFLQTVSKQVNEHKTFFCP